jgi:hypothetical protein
MATAARAATTAAANPRNGSRRLAGLHAGDGLPLLRCPTAVSIYSTIAPGTPAATTRRAAAPPTAPPGAGFHDYHLAQGGQARPGWRTSTSTRVLGTERPAIDAVWRCHAVDTTGSASRDVACHASATKRGNPHAVRQVAAHPAAWCISTAWPRRQRQPRTSHGRTRPGHGDAAAGAYWPGQHDSHGLLYS